MGYVGRIERRKSAFWKVALTRNEAMYSKRRRYISVGLGAYSARLNSD